MYEKLWSLRKQLQHSHNLIHCITNPISMNDCANAVLALGAKPIMAQHPMECEQITACSKALALNLGNFDDSRAIAMKKSLHCANENGIPVIVDMVGGTGVFRLDYDVYHAAHCCLVRSCKVIDIFFRFCFYIRIIFEDDVSCSIVLN